MKRLSQHYLEDFAVGQTFGSGRLRIDWQRALAFAAEFDPQPFHLDEVAARRSIFGGLTASGWHTAAVTRIVDEASLIKTLQSRSIAGAALDVFDEEPLPALHPFRTLSNVLATPHVGYVAEGLYGAFYEDAAASIAAWLADQAIDRSS